MNDNFTTFIGHEFLPNSFSEADVSIKDIAHALSRICRFNGHIKVFHSVAEHCVEVSRKAELKGLKAEVQLYALLHDAAEAYLGDIPTPIKVLLKDYLQYEKQFEQVIFRRFGLVYISDKDYSAVKEIDKEVLYEEWKEYKISGTNRNIATDFNEIEALFLARFNYLNGLIR